MFTGAVNIVEYLGRIHVVVLTSLSESQPLTILEAGAAGIPFVATNVGSCREVIEGRSDEQPLTGSRRHYHAGGRAGRDRQTRWNGCSPTRRCVRAYGETLRKRVRAYLHLGARRARLYTDLYHDLRNQPIASRALAPRQVRLGAGMWRPIASSKRAGG